MNEKKIFRNRNSVFIFIKSFLFQLFCIQLNSLKSVFATSEQFLFAEKGGVRGNDWIKKQLFVNYVNRISVKLEWIKQWSHPNRYILTEHEKKQLNITMDGQFVIFFASISSSILSINVMNRMLYGSVIGKPCLT